MLQAAAPAKPLSAWAWASLGKLIQRQYKTQPRKGLGFFYIKTMIMIKNHHTSLCVLAILATAWSAQASPVAGPSGVQLAQANTNNNAAPVLQRREASAERALAQTATDAGMRTCKPLLDQVNRFLISNSQSAGMAFVSPNHPNTRLFSSSIEIESPQSVTYASAHFAPNGDSNCGVVYDAVTYWAESCAVVSSRLIKDVKPLGTLGSKIAMLDGGPTMRIFLMPAGPGCIQIKKEVMF